MEKFTLINKTRSRIKIVEPFEDSSKNSSMINAILISYIFFSDQIIQLWMALCWIYRRSKKWI